MKSVPEPQENAVESQDISVLAAGQWTCRSNWGLCWRWHVIKKIIGFFCCGSLGSLKTWNLKEGVSGGFQGADSFQQHLSGRCSELQNTGSAVRPPETSSTASTSHSRRNHRPVIGSHQHEHSPCSEWFLSFLGCAELLKTWKQNNALFVQIWRRRKTEVLRRSLCCFSHCVVAARGSAACSAVRGVMKNNPEWEKTVPFPLPAKFWEKIVSYASHPIDCCCSVFSLHLCEHHTYWRGWVHRSVRAVAVSHEADRRQCCQHPSVFLFPGCSFPILDAQTLPVAPCFAVSVVCIALRFRCGTFVLSHTLN